MKKAEHKREESFQNAVAKKMLSKILNEERVSGRMHLKNGRIHLTVYGGHVCHVTEERLHRGYTEV